MSTPQTPEEIRHWILWETTLGRRLPVTGDHAPPPEWSQEMTTLHQAGWVTADDAERLVRRPDPGETIAGLRGQRLILALLETPTPPLTHAGWGAAAEHYDIPAPDLHAAVATLTWRGLIEQAPDGRIWPTMAPPERKVPLVFERLGLRPAAPRTPPPPWRPPAPTTPAVPPHPPAAPAPPQRPPAPQAPEAPIQPAPRTPEAPPRPAAAPAGRISEKEVEVPEAVEAPEVGDPPPRPEVSPSPRTSSEAPPAPPPSRTPETPPEAPQVSSPAPPEAPEALRLEDTPLPVRTMGRLLLCLRAQDGAAVFASVITSRWLTPAQRRGFAEVLEAAVASGAVRRIGRGRRTMYRLGDPAVVGFTPDLAPTPAAVASSVGWVGTGVPK